MAAKPVVLAVDDDADVLRLIKSDLRKQYGDDYRMLNLMTAHADMEAAVKAINKIKIDYYPLTQRQVVAARLETILDRKKNRRPADRKVAAFALLTAACLLVPLAALRPVSADDPERPTAPSLPASSKINPAYLKGLVRMRQWQTTLLSAPSSPWKAALPNGVQVCLTELYALSGSDRNKFWTPAGNILLDTGDKSTSAYYQRFHSRVENIDVTLSFPSDTLRRQARVSFGKQGGHLGTGTNLADFNHNGGFMGAERIINSGFQDFFPPSQEHADLAVSVATGPETVLVSGSPETGGLRRLSAEEVASVTQADTSSKHGRIQVAFRLPRRYVQDESQYQILVIGRDGQPLNGVGASQSYPEIEGKEAVIVYSVKAGSTPNGQRVLSQIQAFQLIYRPSQTAIFRNVALHPVTAGAE